MKKSVRNKLGIFLSILSILMLLNGCSSNTDIQTKVDERNKQSEAMADDMTNNINNQIENKKNDFTNKAKDKVNSIKDSINKKIDEIKKKKSSPVNNTTQDNTSNANNTSSINDGQLKVHFIDVGQADAILIQQGNHNMMIDGGNNNDENTLKNYLVSLGITTFDYVIGTHAHEDHIGSLDYIINSFNVGKVYFPKQTTTTRTYKDFITAVQNKGLALSVPTVGETFNLGNAECTILAPNSGHYEDLNNSSIVVRINYGNNSFLMCGDAEAESEKEMLSKGFNLHADVLKVGHHGSAYGSTQKFLNAVSPKYAVISVGKFNLYGHPSYSTIDKLKKMGVGVYRTDEDGTIIATSDGNNISFNKGL